MDKILQGNNNVLELEIFSTIFIQLNSGATCYLCRRLEYHIDVNTSAVLHFYFAMRWLSVRLDVLATIVTFIVALSVTLAKNDISQSYSAIALVYAAKVSHSGSAPAGALSR